MAATKAPLECPRCTYRWTPGQKARIEPLRLGQSLAGDVLFFAGELGRRARALDEKAISVHAIANALYLAVREGDEKTLRRWAADAQRYRKAHEDDPRRLGLSSRDNATIIRELVALADKLLKDPARAPVDVVFGDPLSRGRILAREIHANFPHLPDASTREALERLQSLIEFDMSNPGMEPARMVERALLHAGMDPPEAHQRFAFLRVARYRAHKRAKAAKQRKAAG
jgi:hypothetical protein